MLEGEARARVKMSFAEIADSGGRMTPWQGNAHLKLEIIRKRRNDIIQEIAHDVRWENLFRCDVSRLDF